MGSETMERKELKPVLKKLSTIKEKNVEIDGNNDFGPIIRDKKKLKQKPQMTTQRISPLNVEQLKLLSYFFPAEENGGSIKSFNEMLGKLMELYEKNVLTPRQKIMFKQLNEKNK